MGLDSVYIPAVIGSSYIDTAATLGATVWRKISGAGNTGWKVQDGDTGWRSVRSWTGAGVVTGDPFPAGWKPRPGQSGRVHIRRINARVLVNWTQLACAVTSTVDRIYTAPAGFAPDAQIADVIDLPMVLAFTSTNVAKQLAFKPKLYRSTVSLSVDDYMSGAGVEYTTSDAWPSSLPGSAA